MAVRRNLWIPLGLSAVLLLAAVLRFWRLDALPPGLYHDEAYYGLDALSLLQGKTFPRFYEGWELYAADAYAGRPPEPTRFPVFFEGNYGREPLHVYLIALSIRLLGATPLAVRAVPAAAGVLAVLTTYLAARSLFPPDERRLLGGELLPLLAALSLAVLYPAVHFSRFGIRPMLFLPCATVAVACFWRGWRPSRHPNLWMAAAGFFVGLGLYTYASARLFPLVFMLFAAFAFRLDRAALRRAWAGLLLMGGTAALTAAPLLLFFARYPYFFLFRMSYVANQGKGTVPDAPWLTWLYNVGRVVGGLFWQGETHLRHNLPGRPYMAPIQAGLFIAGVVDSFRQRRLESIFLLLWFGVMLLPSILSGDAPHFGRMTGAAPAIAILIAAGAVRLVEWFGSRTGWSQTALAGVAVLLFLPGVLLTGRDYFVRYAGHPDLARDFYLGDWEMGRYAAAQPPETTLYLSPSQEEMATIYFALADPERLRSFDEQGSLLPLGLPDKPSLYLLRPDAAQGLSKLQAAFPDGAVEPAGEDFLAYHVPAGVARPQPEMPVSADFGGEIALLGWTLDEQKDYLDITLFWQATAAPARDYTVFVHLLDNAGTLAAQTDRPPSGYPTTDWRPGEVVVDRFRIELPDDPAPGAYRLQTGFYYLPTVERLGDAAELGEIEIGR